MADNENWRPARIPLPARLAKEFLIEEGANACRAPFELLDIERGIQTPQRVAARVVAEGLSVALALLKCLAECEMQLSLIGSIAPVARQQALHCGHIVLAEEVILKVS